MYRRYRKYRARSGKPRFIRFLAHTIFFSRGFPNGLPRTPGTPGLPTVWETLIRCHVRRRSECSRRVPRCHQRGAESYWIRKFENDILILQRHFETSHVHRIRSSNGHPRSCACSKLRPHFECSRLWYGGNRDHGRPMNFPYWSTTHRWENENHKQLLCAPGLEDDTYESRGRALPNFNIRSEVRF